MSDILNLIEEIKGKGARMNNDLTAYSQTNGLFRVKIRERLQSINELIQQLNLADVGKNRADLEQANKDLEFTRKQLEDKQQELQQTRDALTQAQQELASANQSTQALNDQMKALQEESDKKMNDLTQQHVQELEQLRQENAKQLSDSQTATQAEKDQMVAENEQKMKDAEARCNEEKQQMQAQIDEQRKSIEDQMKEAQLAREGAEQKLASLQDSQEKIQVGLGEINQLIENQLALIQKVIASEPSNDDLNAVVEAINMNLSQAMKMLNQTQVQAESQEIQNPLLNPSPSEQQAQPKYTFPMINDVSKLNNQFNMMPPKQKNVLFPSNSSRLRFEDTLRQASQTNNTQILESLLANYNKRVQEYNQKNQLGGRRRRHIVTKHTAKKRYRVPRLSGKPPSAWSEKVVNPFKKTKKVKRQRQQKGGYMYKEDASLRKKSSVVEDKRSSRSSSRETKKRSSFRRSSRMTKKRT
jgi:hypothetical protein